MNAFDNWLSWVRPGFRPELLTLAASLAYTTLLALVPLATVVFSTLSLFPVFDQWAGVVETFIFQNFVAASGEVVYQHLQDFSAQAGKLTMIGLVMLLITSLMLLANIENAFNRIWGVSSGRSAGQRLMVYWTMLTLGPIMIVASLALSSLLFARAFSGAVAELVSDSTFIPLLPFLLELAAFVVMYYFVPNRSTRFRYILAGALIAAVLFEFAKTGFRWYVTEFDSFEVIFGALGVIPIFLVWLYISWLVVLIGASYAAHIGERTSDTPTSE